MVWYMWVVVVLCAVALAVCIVGMILHEGELQYQDLFNYEEDEDYYDLGRGSRGE